MFRQTLPALFATLLIGSVWAEEPKELVKARREFEQVSMHPDESVRIPYIIRLVAMRERYAIAGNTAAWKAVDDEVRDNPMPENVDRRALAKLLIGMWRSPRHDYLYKWNGSWTMLPAGKQSPHGKWRIKGNQFSSTTAVSPPAEPDQFTLILLDETNFIYADQGAVFYLTRIGKSSRG